ncbi:geranylgeranyl pyrophosphate synthase-like protein [Xylogone sp. PMI_703]|nr:geranylgeranyl pyrophosphate synthase-like protein [Xylogone sp. PMI_703]
MAFEDADSSNYSKSDKDPAVKINATPRDDSNSDSNFSHLNTEQFKTSFGKEARTEDLSNESSRDAATIAWCSSHENIIRGPFNHLFFIPGKGNRKRFIAAVNKLLAVPEEKVSIIGEAVEILHTASLLIDDIQDNSKLRRGYPSAHIIFGEAQVINSANHAYFLALESLHELGHPQAVVIFTEEILNLHRGQGMDLFWRDSLLCPTEEEYLDMVKNKTGGLFRLALRLLQSQSPIEKNLIPLGEIIGQIYQMRDDYQNLQNDEYIDEKGFCEDLTEGKFSFPIIHSIRKNPSSTLLMNILRQRTDNFRLKQHALSYIESTGSFEYTKRRISEMIAKATQLVKDMNTGGNKSDQLFEILELLAV